MTSALLVLGYTLFVLAAGIAIGATIIRDVLDGLWVAPRRPLWPRKPTLPVARLLQRVEERRLVIPTVLRKRQRIEVIDV